jgi:hypothetical protein
MHMNIPTAIHNALAAPALHHTGMLRIALVTIDTPRDVQTCLVRVQTRNSWSPDREANPRCFSLNSGGRQLPPPLVPKSSSLLVAPLVITRRTIVGHVNSGVRPLMSIGGALGAFAAHAFPVWELFSSHRLTINHRLLGSMSNSDTPWLIA